MRHEGNDEVLLFESEEDEEALCISCRATKEGGLVIHQMSEGELTAWCFEESPHEVEDRFAAGHRAHAGVSPCRGRATT